MGLFTSNGTGGGNFNADATWTAGSGYPGAGDNFTIVAGDTVTYNISSANELGGGDMTINGLLTFLNNANTKMVIANGQRIVIANGGELRIGASGAVIAAANTAELYWNESADDADAISISDGGKLTIYGDPTYYGSDGETTLADNAENTDGDDIIKTADDMSALWNVGDEICIRIKTAYSDYNTDVILRTIGSFDGVDGTLITVTGGNVTTDSGCVGKVINVTRNVKLGKLSPVTTIGNYNASTRPGITNANTSIGNINLSNVLITGILYFTGGTGYTLSACTIRNSYIAFNNIAQCNMTGNIYSVTYGINTNNYGTISVNLYCVTYGFSTVKFCTIEGDIFSNYRGFNTCKNNTIAAAIYLNGTAVSGSILDIFTGNIYKNYNAFDGNCCHCTISGNVYSNSYAFSACTSIFCIGRIGYTAGDISAPNTCDFYFTGCNEYLLRNCKIPLAGFVMIGRNTDGAYEKIKCAHYNRVLNDHRIFDNVGNILKVVADGTGDAPSVDPDSGNDDVIELSLMQSNCNSYNPLQAFEHYIWAEADVEKTYTYKVQTTYAGISAGNLKLTATYLDEESGGHVTTATNAPAISQRSNDADWTQSLAVTITPTQEGWVRLKIELMEYESGNEVWIYPKPYIT